MSRTVNPITTAIRSWVLRSPARLALGLLITVVALVAIRGVITTVTGGTVGSATETVAVDAAASATPTPTAVAEVTESEVLGLSSTSVTDTPARAAMFYAHAFLDTAATPTQWTVRLSTVTDPGNITDRIAEARPTTPVTILGPTRTTRTAGEAGTRVEIDTSAGTLTATLTDSGDRWQLKSPLPTIDLTALPTTSTTTPRPTTMPPSPTRPSTTSTPAPPSTTPPARPFPHLRRRNPRRHSPQHRSLPRSPDLSRFRISTRPCPEPAHDRTRNRYPDTLRSSRSGSVGDRRSVVRMHYRCCDRPTPPVHTHHPHHYRRDSGRGSTGNGTPSAATDLTESAPIRLPTAPGTTTKTSGFGPRWGTMHRGVDFAGPEGTPIYSALDGTVILAGSSGEGPGVGFENWIVIDSLVDGSAVSTVYGHMWPNGIHVKPGDKVTAGQHIAEIGNAGGSTGPHLHFEYWPGGKLTGGTAIDPMGPLTGAPAPDGAPAPSASQPADPDAPTSTATVRLASATGCTNKGFGVPGAGQLKAGSVPPEFEEWFRKAGSLCPQISPALLAADTKAESGFRVQTSGAGARGYTQFIDETWAVYGKDEDGNGVISRSDIGDAVMAQGHYMCDNAAQIDAWIADGSVKGDPKSLYIAAYNTGSGAVKRSGGMPSGHPDYENETKPYVAKVLAYEAEFTDPNAGGAFIASPASPAGPQVITAARQHLGLPYGWGGGNINGPSGGGFDCSGLTSYAIYQGTGGRVTLPRTSEQQWTVGTEIPVDQAGPGDLLFGNFQSTGPGHVALALGGGQMIEAPQTGDVVKQSAVRSDMKARRVL